MTSNQGIVRGELGKARHSELVRESAAQALQDLKDGAEKDVSAPQLAVDWMVGAGRARDGNSCASRRR